MESIKSIRVQRAGLGKIMHGLIREEHATHAPEMRNGQGYAAALGSLFQSFGETIGLCRQSVEDCRILIEQLECGTAGGDGEWISTQRPRLIDRSRGSDILEVSI